MMPIILLLLALLSIFIEFFMPGGIFGTIGALLYLTSVVLFAMQSDSIVAVMIFIVTSVILVGFTIRFALWKIKKSKTGASFYSEGDQSGYIASTWDKDLIHKRGVVTTELRPGGHIKIEGKQYSAISQSGYLAKGEEVVVVAGEGETLYVVKAEQIS